MNIKRYKIGSIGAKVALITDLHFEKFFNCDLLDEIVSILKQEKPNYICLSGDIIDQSYIVDDKELMDKLFSFIKELSMISKTIVNLGNHETQDKKGKGNIEKVKSVFLKLNTMENVYYLYNKSYINEKICFTSIDFPFEYYNMTPSKKTSEIFINKIDNDIHLKPIYYNILLCHSPIDVFKDNVLKESKEMKKVNLVLSGHMHNGMVPSCLDLFGNRGIFGPYNKLFPKYARGIVKKENKILIISGGITKISHGHSKTLSSLNKYFSPSMVIVDI